MRSRTEKLVAARENPDIEAMVMADWLVAVADGTKAKHTFA